MSTILQGLAAIQEEMAKRTSGDYEDRPKAKYVSLKDGESVKLTFLQEIDEGSPAYSSKNGLALFSLQHSNPDNWRKSAACTAADGECYGCQKGWKQKVVFYVNVLVEDGENEPYVAIFNKGLGKGSVAQGLLNMAADGDYNNSITDKVFKFSRIGDKKDNTQYTLSPLPKASDKNVESYELFNLKDYIFTVKPEKQEAYYYDGLAAESAPAASAPSSPSASSNLEW